MISNVINYHVVLSNWMRDNVIPELQRHNYRIFALSVNKEQRCQQNQHIVFDVTFTVAKVENQQQFTEQFCIKFFTANNTFERIFSGIAKNRECIVNNASDIIGFVNTIMQLKFAEKTTYIIDKKDHQKQDKYERLQKDFQKVFQDFNDIFGGTFRF